MPVSMVAVQNTHKYITPLSRAAYERFMIFLSRAQVRYAIVLARHVGAL